MSRILPVLSVLLIMSFGSCKLWNPNQLFRTDNNYSFDEVPEEAFEPYRIKVGDKLGMRLYTNDGYKLVDAGLSNIGTGAIPTTPIAYTIDVYGNGQFPLVGEVALKGLTLLEAADSLEARYRRHIIAPWVQLTVLNRRAIVFLGNGNARVVPLENDQMNLLEVLAAAGGIPETSRAYRVKVIRGEGELTKMSMLDLRDPTNLPKAQMLVQANDVLIVDPAFDTELLGQLTPFLAVLTSGIVIYSLLVRTN